MGENNRNRNYNNSQHNQETDLRYEQSTYMPNQYNYNDRGYTDSFYEEYEESGAGSFLLGAIVGGVIGAAAALFLAPKSGKEMRDDFSTQAAQLKEKGIEISTVAKDKATEFTSVAKDKATELSSVAKEKATEFSSVAKDKASEFTSAAKVKTDEVTKTIQEQSGQLVDKVKTMTSKTSVPMDDGTVSFEGEEATEFIEKVTSQQDDNEVVTATAEAIKNAVINSDSKQ